MHKRLITVAYGRRNVENELADIFITVSATPTKVA